MKKLFSLFAFLFLISACGQDRLVGTWIQPIPGMEDQIQGFKLNADGSAESINMHTLVYNAWSNKNNTLTLKGESIGNGQTIKISEQFEIQNLTKDTLTLRLQDSVFTYTRQKP